MPKTEKTYPDWVQEYRTRGTTVKKKGRSITSTSELQGGFPERNIHNL